MSRVIAKVGQKENLSQLRGPSRDVARLAEEGCYRLVGWEGTGTRVLGDGGGHIGLQEPCGCYADFVSRFLSPQTRGRRSILNGGRNALSWERE